MTTTTRVLSPLRLALALALVGGGATVALNLEAFFPRWTVTFKWTGEGSNPAAFAISVGRGHNRAGQRDWNDVGYKGLYVSSGSAKSGDIIVASGLPTNPSYMTCVLTIDDKVADTDPNSGREPILGNGALCKGVAP